MHSHWNCVNCWTKKQLMKNIYWKSCLIFNGKSRKIVLLCLDNVCRDILMGFLDAWCVAVNVTWTLTIIESLFFMIFTISSVRVNVFFFFVTLHRCLVVAILELYLFERKKKEVFNCWYTPRWTMLILGQLRLNSLNRSFM